jgi:hypothetical protein
VTEHSNVFTGPTKVVTRKHSTLFTRPTKEAS